MNPKLFYIAIGFGILGLTMGLYSLFQYNYSESKEAMSLVMPDFMVKDVYASDFASDMEKLRQGIPLGPDPPDPKKILAEQVGKNMTYDRMKYIEKNSMCKSSTLGIETNATLEAECEYIMFHGNELEDAHEAELEAIKESKQLAFLNEMGFKDKTTSILEQCKVLPVNASIVELRECIDFTAEYAEQVIGS